jgi:hypothetical protein
MKLLTINKEKIFKLEILGFTFLVFYLINFFGSGVSKYVDIVSILAQTEEADKESITKNKDITTITVTLNKNNVLNIENENNNNLLKIVGYLNGEGQTKYVDLKEINKEINQNEKFLKIDLEFNKSNDISSTMIDDEYYVCAYVMKDSNITDDVTSSTTIPLYDCDEGNIGTSTIKDSVTLFSTMKKYGESKSFYTTNQNTAPAISNPKEVKITINVPVYDSKNIDDMNVVAMVKGEYQIKTIDLQNEIENGKNKNDLISVPFNFNRQTEVGAIEIGDLFFGCATSDEFPNQNSDCEKKMIKDLDKVSTICARKDNSC